MKNAAWVLSAIALVWCAILTFGKGSSAPQAIANGQLASVAFVHGDSIQLKYDLISDLQELLQIQVSDIEAQLQAKAQPLQVEAQELINFAQNSNPTPEEMNMARQRIAEIEEEMGFYQQQAERAAANREQQMQNMIALTLREDIAVYAAEEGIDVVLNWGLSGEGVLHGNPGFDITESLLAFLNERYADTKAKHQAELEAATDTSSNPS